MNIALDMMGGDFAPSETVKGVRLFLADSSPAVVNLFLIGDETLVAPLLIENGIDPSKVKSFMPLRSLA